MSEQERKLEAARKRALASYADTIAARLRLEAATLDATTSVGRLAQQMQAAFAGYEAECAVAEHEGRVPPSVEVWAEQVDQEQGT